MRLIDADAMRAEWLEDGENEYVYDTNCMLDSIDKQPTIDAAPVRHGKWIRSDSGETFCSECNRNIPHVECFDFYPDCCADDEDMGWDVEIERTNYCPNCGSRMDLEDDGND